MTGEQHERAVEAAGRAFAAQSTWGRDRNPEYVAMVTERVGPALDAYHRSLREQGAVLVDLRAVVGFVREWQDDWNEGAMVPPPADALERRFGGTKGASDG